MKKYYRVMLGQKSKFSDMCKIGNFIGADFLPNEDLNGRIPDNFKEFNKEFAPVWLAANPGKSKISGGLACGALWTVVKWLEIGDIVLCPNGRGYYNVGVIDGDYYYIPGEDLPHRRKVKWLDKVILRADMTERLRNSVGSIGTCSDITKYSTEVEELIKNAKTNNQIADKPSVIDNGPIIEQDQDPEQLIKETHQLLSNKLADEILDYVLTLSPEQFEKLVLQLLVKMGYGQARHTGRTGDEGIDGIIDEDKLGIDEIHIQAKRYKIGNNISRDTLQAFVGALAGKNSRKGIFITTSDFTKLAQEYVPNGVRIVKINGVRLAKLMIEYNLGVRTKDVYEVKTLDKSFFD